MEGLASGEVAAASELRVNYSVQGHPPLAIRGGVGPRFRDRAFRGVSPFTLKLSIARRSSQSLMSASICRTRKERAGAKSVRGLSFLHQICPPRGANLSKRRIHG